MKKAIYLSIFITLFLKAGFFPATVSSSITGVSGSTAQLSRPFPVDGMSGVVIHKYSNGLSAITSIIVQTSSGSGRLTRGDLLDHKGLPTPRSLANVGDRVIGGYLYNNVLLIAPNAQTYSKITRGVRKHWIHPDSYASFLIREGDSSISKSNLEKFAKEAQVGLVYIVKRDSAILYDPISRRVVAQRAFSPVGDETKYPFYTRFTSLKSGFFGRSAKGSYYKKVGAIR
jgi:hypothetical protein